jgi:hypothetical protein
MVTPMARSSRGGASRARPACGPRGVRSTSPPGSGRARPLPPACRGIRPARRPASRRRPARRHGARRCAQVAPVHRVEAEPVHLQPRSAHPSAMARSAASPPPPREVAHAAQQPAGDARRAARAPRDLRRAVLGSSEAELPAPRRTISSSSSGVVEVQPQRDAEAVAQRRGEQPARVVAPTSVKGGRSMRTCAPPAPRR